MQRRIGYWRTLIRARWMVLLICGVVGHSARATAQSSGTFSPTSNMTTARSGHTATLLPDGHVLILGGGSVSSSDGVLASAEIFDPASGKFQPAGMMLTPRRWHTATLLADDTVLIVGGHNERGALATAEIFDPATGTSAAVGSLSKPRGGHSAILLSTGKVLVIGGYGTNTYPDMAPAEVYDPTSRTFSPAGPYIGHGGCDFCAPSVLLADGTVLFPGQNPAQVYDPATDSFSPAGTMIGYESAAAVLTSGQVLFAGGEDLGRSFRAELYDPLHHVFMATANMSWRRVWHSLTWLPDGSVLAAGGETDTCTSSYCYFAGSVSSAELYDPSAGTFHATGSMTVPREAQTATLLRDGRVLIAGGVVYGGIGLFGGSIASAELYTPDVLMPAPVLVAISSDGPGRGTIYHAGTTDAVIPDDPATADEDLDLYCTGIQTNSVIRPQVAIGGRMAIVISVGDAPGIRGVTRVRVRVPSGVVPPESARVRVTYVDRVSDEIAIAVR